jgi:starvation-inducible outer membrane lipoprotein
MKNAFLLASILAVVIFVSGCTSSEPVYSGSDEIQSDNTGNVQEQPIKKEPTTTVATLGTIFAITGNWDADAEDDGLELYINPKDAEDHLVAVDGVISATLWKRIREDPYSIEFVKGDVIKEWEGIEIKKSDFDFMGAEIRLEFDEDYTPEQYESGTLEVKLDVQGKTFEAVQESVLLGY